MAIRSRASMRVWVANTLPAGTWKQNTRFHGNAGAYWRVLNLPELGTLVLGANFFGMHYAHNLRYFSYGQGGYFSPEAYFLAAMPLSWTGHYGPDLHYTVTGSIGAQSFQEDSSAFFPLDPGLQTAFGSQKWPVHAARGVKLRSANGDGLQGGGSLVRWRLSRLQ